jgi:hypothetical protein
LLTLLLSSAGHLGTFGFENGFFFNFDHWQHVFVQDGDNLLKIVENEEIMTFLTLIF